MNTTHRKTLAAIFASPTPTALEWRRIESLFLALGVQTIEGSGSRVRFEFNGVVVSFHRPRPQKEAKPYQVKDAKRFLQQAGTAMNVMTYKGFSARIEYSEEDECFVGHIAGIRDVVGFHGESVTELKAAFNDAVDDYVATCEKLGRAPQKPYSGKLMLRLDPALHAKVAMLAEAQGKSLNAWAQEVFSQVSGN